MEPQTDLTENEVKILCVAEKKNVKKFKSFLRENHFLTFHSRGALKSAEILKEQNSKIRLILWNIEKEFGFLQYELAEVFNEYSEIPIIILTKSNLIDIDFEKLLKSKFRILDLFEGSRFILKEINSVIYHSEIQKELQERVQVKMPEDRFEFNNLFSKNFRTPDNNLSAKVAGNYKINLRPKITFEEREMLLKGDSNKKLAGIANAVKNIFSKSDE